MSKVKEAVKHSLFRTVSVVSTLLVIGAIGWFVYVGMIKPHTRPTATTSQKAENIENVVYNYPEKKNILNVDFLWGWVRFGVGPLKDIKKK